MDKLMRWVKILLLILTVSLWAEAPVIFVTGGAGYIGSHTCQALKNAGFLPVTYDSLVRGSKEMVKWGPLVEGDINDIEALDWAFSTYKPVAVIHFAAFRSIGESIQEPYKYYYTNVCGTLNLLQVMLKHGVKNIIFSSSCSVYGNSSSELITEDEPKKPLNPYAMSKMFMESILHDFERAYGIRSAILRYFNAAGIDYRAGLRRMPNACDLLIPKALLAVLYPETPLFLFGTDYPTADGTAVRDYIHILDLSRAHILALEQLQRTGVSMELNLGIGKGYSVYEVIRVVESVTGRKVPVIAMPRRDGDACRAVADISKAREVLKFTPEYVDLHSMVESEWKAMLTR